MLEMAASCSAATRLCVHVCRSAVQQTMDQPADGPDVRPGGTELNLLEPDRRLECKASIGLGYSNAVWSTISVNLMQLSLAGQSPLEMTSSTWSEVRVHICRELMQGSCMELLVLAVQACASSGSQQSESVCWVTLFQLTSC